MNFIEALNVIKKEFNSIGVVINGEYDGIIVKKLEASNTLDDGRTTNQTHIAITGEQMDMFPYFRSDGYFANDDSAMKKYFIPQIPVFLQETNCDYLGCKDDISFRGSECKTKTSVIRSKRNDQADQIQLSLINEDGKEFIDFRKSLHSGSYLIFLKRKKKFEYEVFGVKSSDVIPELNALNNKFYKENENTTVGINDLLEIVPERTIDNLSIVELGAILKKMYDEADDGNKTAATHMFGLKYGDAIQNNRYTVAEIVRESTLRQTVEAEVNIGVRMHDAIKKNLYDVKYLTKYNILPKATPRARTRYDLNRILYGAPGTGKTYSTAKYSLAVIENRELSSYDSLSRIDLMEKYNQYVSKGQIVFTTFHQNYGYEDFVQGLRPYTKMGNISFALKDGIFKELSFVAMSHPEKDYVLIIDEINRANISKVFGELITLIEPDKRWGEENSFSITLPSGETFAVPNNLYIIGTMNSADKSIALIDTALRRRFKFVEVPPKAELIVDIKLQDLFIKLNETLRNSLDSSDLLVGHAYFIGKQYSDLETILNDNVIPLLYEYYFGDEPSVYNAISTALGTNSDYNIIHNTSGKDISRIRIEKK